MKEHTSRAATLLRASLLGPSLLGASLLGASLLACEGGVEPPPLYVGGVEAGGPMGMTPVNTEPTASPLELREDCGPLLPVARALFVDPAPSAPATLLKACKNCHNAPSPGNDFVLPPPLDNPTLSPEDIQLIYTAASPFLTVGEGAGSEITRRLSDEHSNISRYAPDAPEVTAMTAWINALTACP
jgi:hypothetical protein